MRKPSWFYWWPSAEFQSWHFLVQISPWGVHIEWFNLPPLNSWMCLWEFPCFCCRSLCFPANYGSEKTWAGLPCEQWSQLSAVPTLREWRAGSEHGGVCAELISWRLLPKERRICKCLIPTFLLFSPFAAWLLWLGIILGQRFLSLLSV